MTPTWKKWLNSFVRTTRRKAPIRRPRLLNGAESLEDRVVPAVTVGDLKSAIGQLQQQVHAAIEDVRTAASLGFNLQIVDQSLSKLLDATSAVDQTLTEASNANQSTIVDYLTKAIPAATNNLVTVPYSDTSDADSVKFRLQVAFSDSRNDLVPDLEKILGGIQLGTPAGLTLQFSNSLTGYFNLQVDHSSNQLSIQFIPGAISSDPSGQKSEIEYKPQLNASLNSNGLIANTLAYHLSGSVNFSPTLTFTYGSSSTPVGLTAVAQPTINDTTGFTHTKLTASIQADLTTDPDSGFKLPKFGYGQTFSFDVKDGTSSLSDPNFYVDGMLITTTNATTIATDVGLAVLKEHGIDAVHQLSSVLPDQLVKLLLGDVEIYDGYQLKDLVSLVGFDTPLDALQLIGVPKPAIDVLTAVLKATELEQELGSIDMNAPPDQKVSKLTEVKQKFSPQHSASKFYYVGEDVPGEPTLTDVITSIFKGERVPLVEYTYDLSDDPYVQGLKQAGVVQIKPLDNGVGGKTNYILGDLDIDGDKLIDQIVSKLPAGALRDAASDVLHFAVDNGIGDFSLQLHMKLAAAFRVGFDSTFLLPQTTGTVLEKVEKSVYVSSGNLIDFHIDGEAKVSASVADAAQAIWKGAEHLRDTVVQQGGEAAKKIQGFVNDPVGTTQGALSTAAEQIGLGLTGADIFGRASADLKFQGGLMFGVCDPVVNNGRLTLYDFTTYLQQHGASHVTDFFAAHADLSFQASGSASIAGISPSFELPRVTLFDLTAGCSPGPDGPSLSDFKDDTPTASTPNPAAVKVFAEVRTLPTGASVLQVYGSAASDAIRVVRDPVSGLILVGWNGQVLGFDPSTFTAVIIGLRSQAELQALGAADPSADAIVPADGGNDDVTIAPSVPSTIPVIVYGGSGNDTIRPFVGDRTVLANNYSGRAAFYGGGGNDTLYGTAGDLSLVAGEAGDDTIYAGLGANVLDGGPNNDQLYGLPEIADYPPVSTQSVYIGGTGNDYISVGNRSRGNNILIGGTSDGTGDAGVNVIYGGPGDETIIAGNATQPDPNVVAFVPAGDGSGNGIALGGPGNDTIYGTNNADLLIGGTFNATDDAGRDVIHGAGGGDAIVGGNADIADGMLIAVQTVPGSGTLFGDDGNDYILGGSGNDTIDGGAGNDTIDAGFGQNTIHGGGDDDTFILGRGIDTAFGEGGNDLFLLTNPAGTIYAPGGFITIDGGGQAGDEFRMSGGGGAGFSETYTAGTTGSDGLINTTPAVGNLVQSIRFNSLAQIRDSVTAASLAVLAPGSADDITVGDGGILGGNAATEVRSNHFVPIQFNRKTALTVDAGGGADTVLVDNAFPALGLTSLIVRGGAGGDDITITNVDATVRAKVFGDDGDDNITVLNDNGLTIESTLQVIGGGGRNVLKVTGDPGSAIARETLGVTGPAAGVVVFDRDGSGGPGANGATLGTDSEQVSFSDVAEVIDLKPLTTGQLDVLLLSYSEGITVADGGRVDGAVTTAISGAAPTIRFANKPVVTVSGLAGTQHITVNNPTPADGLARLELYGNELTGGLLAQVAPALADDDAADYFDVRAVAVPLVIDGQGGDDAVRVSSTAGLDDRGNLDGIRGALTLRGGGGTNTLFVSDYTSATANASARITATGITGLAGPADATPITYTEFATLTVRGSNTAGDGFTVASPAAALTLTTEGGDDTVRVESLTRTSDVNTGAGSDLVVVANQSNSLAGIQAALSVDGGGGADDRLVADDSGTAAGQGYTLSDTTLTRTRAAAVTYANVDRLEVYGSAGANTYDVPATGATVSTLVSDGEGGSRFTVQGDGLQAANTFRGNGGNDRFVLNAGLGFSGTALRVSGGAGDDDLDVNARVGNDVVTVRVTDTTGAGTLAGLGLTADFDTLERIGLDGKGGRNSLNWIDDTNQVFGTALAPESGVVVRPLGVASGDVRIGLAETRYPTVAFVNVGGDFTVSGDGDGSGDRDVVTVLAATTAGLQSPWGELATADGSDDIDVTDRLVTITDRAAGPLRSVSLADAGASPTISTLYVRGGAEGRVDGDNFTATPSARLNILLDGMDPTSGRPGDNLKVRWVGSRSLVKSRDPLLGPDHARFVQDSDGASVGFERFEKVYDTQVALTGSGPGTETRVIISDPTTGGVRYADKMPFPGFFGGVTVASADVNGDSVADVVVGAGNGGGPVIVVYDGIEGFEVARFAAYEESFRGGVIVSAADVDGDGYADIVTGTGVGGGPRVIVLSGKDQSVLQNFFAYESTFRDGVQVAAGDTNGDGFADILTGTGRGGAPRVVLFDGVTNQVRADFFAFDPNSRFGVSVGLGDLDGDFISDLIAGDGSATEPHVRAFRGRDAGLLADFMVNDPFAPAAIPVLDRESGVRVGATDLDGDGVADILAGKGQGTRPVLRGYKVATVDPVTKKVSVGLSENYRETMFDPGVYGWGIEVGGSD